MAQAQAGLVMVPGDERGREDGRTAARPDSRAPRLTTYPEATRARLFIS